VRRPRRGLVITVLRRAMPIARVQQLTLKRLGTIAQTAKHRCGHTFEYSRMQ